MPDRVTITGVKPAEMNAVWPLVSGYFQTFADLSKGEAPAGELLYQVMQGTRQCWVALRDGEIIACVLTEIVGSHAKAVHITFGAGRERQEWRDEMMREIETWGQAHGATRCRVIGRTGWARDLPHYKEVARVIERELSDADV